MTVTVEFAMAYARLNQSQQDAVRDDLGRPLVVVGELEWAGLRALADEVERLRRQLGDALVASHNTEAALRGEGMRLQGVIDGMAARIASQSEALSQAAERSATARLQAWAKKDERRDHQISKTRVILMQRVPDSEGMLRDISAMASEIPAGLGEYGRRVYLGRGATTGQMIDAALTRWEELYGGQ